MQNIIKLRYNKILINFNIGLLVCFWDFFWGNVLFQSAFQDFNKPGNFINWVASFFPYSHTQKRYTFLYWGLDYGSWVKHLAFLFCFVLVCIMPLCVDLPSSISFGIQAINYWRGILRTFFPSTLKWVTNSSSLLHKYFERSRIHSPVIFPLGCYR